VQAAKACCIPAGRPIHVPGFGAKERNEHINRKPLARKFRSSEEAFFLSGILSSAIPSGGDSIPGASLHAMPLFDADKHLDRSHGDCKKHMAATGALTPGLMVCG
jgi:hypothetical protein